MKLILLGPPGAGKGTISDKLVAEYGLAHISTGDMLRSELRAKTELGMAAKSFIDAGKLVSDEVIIKMVEKRLGEPDCRAGYILDGFPRTVEQAEALSSFASIDVCLELSAPDELVVSRISGRRVCRKCSHVTNVAFVGDSAVCPECGGELYVRDDDKPETIKARLEVYKAQTAPLIGYYRDKGLLKTVDANSTSDELFLKIKKVLGEI